MFIHRVALVPIFRRGDEINIRVKPQMVGARRACSELAEGDVPLLKANEPTPSEWMRIRDMWSEAHPGMPRLFFEVVEFPCWKERMVRLARVIVRSFCIPA